MLQTRPRFVTVPIVTNLKDKHLKYKDLLTYAALISFNNWMDELCYPTYTSIAKRADMSRVYVIASLERLEKAGLITVIKATKKKVSNRYRFTETEQFVTASYSLFNKAELTPNEKAMLIAIRQFFRGENHDCIFSDPVKNIAQYLGLTYKTVYTQYMSLVKKGYIIDKVELYKGLYKTRVVQLSTKLLWTFKEKTRRSIFDIMTQEEIERIIFRPTPLPDEHDMTEVLERMLFSSTPGTNKSDSLTPEEPEHMLFRPTSTTNKS